jgi:hypothetical protein
MRSFTFNSDAKRRCKTIAWLCYCRLFARNKLPHKEQNPNSGGTIDLAFQRRRSLRGTIASALFLCIAVLTCLHLEHRAKALNADIASRESRPQTEADYFTILESSKHQATAPRVLVLGNSLLYWGVEFPKVQESLAPEIDAKRYVVVNTSYFDWYYTMKKLFDEGAKADVVVLVLSPYQLSAMDVREDYFAHHLMKLHDLFSIARDLKLTNTEMSSFALANISQFYDLRGRIRNKQLSKIFPNMGALTSLITRRANPWDKILPESLFIERLRALRDLAAKSNARFALVIPPFDGGRIDPNVPVVESAGKKAGVQVLVPIKTGALAADHYQDGFHLNELGNEVFTRELIATLKTEVPRQIARKATTIVVK